MQSWLLLLAIACSGVAAATLPGSGQPAAPSQPPLPAQPPAVLQGPVVQIGGPSLKISAEDLTVAYAQNEKEARQRFAKQLILVEGTVLAVNQKSDFLIYVVLTGHPRKTYDSQESNCWLICLLPKSLAETAAGLKAGDKVQIVGTCQGVIPSEGVRVLFSGNSLSRKE
jgi:hypothetical protein